MWSRVLPLLMLVLAGCSHPQRHPKSSPVDIADWHKIITEQDKARLRDWRDTLTAALETARKAGNGLSIDREGALLDPDAALTGAAPHPGSYQCRVIKIGAQKAIVAQYTVYPHFKCDIASEAEVLSFAKRDGVQRPVGLIFKDQPLHQVFLGTMMLGDETLALQYGRDSTRDMVGYVERIGANRWRLCLPAPHFESMMDVIELIPDKNNQ